MKRLPADQRREQLLDRAAELFARHGYARATTAELAKAAGVTEPIIYRHFKSKRDLFISLIERTGRETLDVWERDAHTALPGLPPMAALAFTDDGARLFAVEPTGAVHLVEVASGRDRVLGRPVLPEVWTRALARSDDGTRVAWIQSDAAGPQTLSQTITGLTVRNLSSTAPFNNPLYSSNFSTTPVTTTSSTARTTPAIIATHFIISPILPRRP